MRIPFKEEIPMGLKTGRDFSRKHMCEWGQAAILIWGERGGHRNLILNTERYPGLPLMRGDLMVYEFRVQALSWHLQVPCCRVAPFCLVCWRDWHGCCNCSFSADFGWRVSRVCVSVKICMQRNSQKSDHWDTRVLLGLGYVSCQHILVLVALSSTFSSSSCGLYLFPASIPMETERTKWAPPSTPFPLHLMRACSWDLPRSGSGSPEMTNNGLLCPLTQVGVTPSLFLVIGLNGQAHTCCISFNISNNPMKEH